jgi:hypothetical protein
VAIAKTMLWTASALLGWELLWWVRRKHVRQAVFACARARAKALGKPLVVVGAPDLGPTMGPGCGHVTLDIRPSDCPNGMVVDITKAIAMATDSAVVFVSYVLEYVDDYEKALSNLQRVAGANLFIIRVEPWTLTAYLYPGARRVVPSIVTTLDCEATA